MTATRTVPAGSTGRARSAAATRCADQLEVLQGGAELQAFGHAGIVAPASATRRGPVGETAAARLGGQSPGSPRGCRDGGGRRVTAVHVLLLVGCAAAIYVACEWFVNAVEWLGVELGVGTDGRRARCSPRSAPRCRRAS